MTSNNNKKNSFKDLEDEDLDKNPQAPKQVEDDLNANINSIQTFGNVVELYLSKVIGLFVAILGGKKNEMMNDQTTESNNDTDNAPEGRSNRID